MVRSGKGNEKTARGRGEVAEICQATKPVIIFCTTCPLRPVIDGLLLQPSYPHGGGEVEAMRPYRYELSARIVQCAGADPIFNDSSVTRTFISLGCIVPV